MKDVNVQNSLLIFEKDLVGYETGVLLSVSHQNSLNMICALSHKNINFCIRLEVVYGHISLYSAVKLCWDQQLKNEQS